MKEELIQEIFRKSSNSNRVVRWATLLLVVCSIVSLLSLYNSLNDNWIDSRVELHENIVKWYPFDMGHSAEMGESYHDYFSAKQYFEKRGYTIGSAKQVLEELRKRELNYVISVSLPFFGIFIDINDLALISGVSFCVVLSILYFCLRQKESHLLIISGLIEGTEDDETCKYMTRLVYMNQTFSVPTRNDEDRKSIIHVLADSLCLMPLIVFSLILVYDLLTFKVGLMFNFEVTIMSVFFSFVLLASLFFLTLKVKSRISQIELTWNRIPNISEIL